MDKKNRLKKRNILEIRLEEKTIRLDGGIR